MPSLGPLNRPLRFLRRLLPSVNFLVLHWLYFILTCLISAIIFWGSSTPSQSITFTNSLFFTVSAMTEAGLNPVNLSQLNTWQQVMLFLLILIGSPIWVSIYVIYVRRKAFRDRFASDEKRSRLSRLSRSASGLGKIKRGASMATSETQANRNEGIEQHNMNLVNRNPPDQAEVQDGGSLSRDPTPPERRGGPEMNRTISMAEDAPEQPLDGRPPASLPQVKPSAITFRDDTQFSPAHPTHGNAVGQAKSGVNKSHSQLFSMQGVGARPTNSLHSTTALNLSSFPSFQRTETMMSENKFHGDVAQYFHSASGWISRNSQFHNLTSTERDELGGYEYRAIEFLAWLVPAYLVLWQLLGCLGCGAWVYVNTPDTARTNGLNPFWVGAFNAVSAFNNSGMSLLDANMVAFQRSYYMLITMSLLILAGNTAFPPFLRLIVWTFHKYYQHCAKGKPDSHPTAKHAQTLRFLLDHPRRCYTNLFPSQETWWLAASVFSLNAIDWAAFEILNIGNKQLTTGLPLRYRVIDGLFQAFAVRSGGFYVVTIPNLRISLLVLYVVMMYISVYPVVITIRNSNVYEERSLGIYAEEHPEDFANVANNADRTDDTDATKPRSYAGGVILKRARTIGGHLASLSVAQPAAQQETNTHFIQHQLRAQIAHDAWFIVLALFLIMIVEASRFEQQPVIFSVFNFIFEIVSAYGCVGISIGVPYADYSFSGAWRILSKLILCAVMLRGRHRGLPVAIDKAVMLPGEEQVSAEEEDGRIRLARSMTLGRWEDGIE